MKRLLAAALCLTSITGAWASDFFSTEKCDQFFTFGARFGINTTNRTLDSKSIAYDAYTHQSWGTGIDVGVVANLNFRDYLTIQPGFFYESRSGRYTLMGHQDFTDSEIAQTGKRNSYNFTIPVMAVIGFNITDDIRWTVEAGPYVSFLLSSKLKNERFVINGTSTIPLFDQKAASVDFGFKMGFGVKVLQHYYCGIHYLAGCVPAWKDLKIDNLTKDFGGVTKGWVFSIGYDF